MRRANHTRNPSRLGRIKHLEAHLKALGPVVHSRQNVAVHAELPYNGLSVTFANPRIDGDKTMTVTYTVTCAAGAAPMTVRTTPTAQSVAGWE